MMYQYMFEIVLKHDYEDFYFYREFEVNGVTNNSSVFKCNESKIVTSNGTNTHNASLLIPSKNNTILKYDSPLRPSIFSLGSDSQQPKSTSLRKTNRRSPSDHQFNP